MGLSSLSATGYDNGTVFEPWVLELEHPYWGNRREHVVAGRVVSLAGEVIRGASVHVSPLTAGDLRDFKTDASGDFQTVYLLNVGPLADFRVRLTVRKNGFQTAHELIDYADFPKAVRLPITLRPEKPDPKLLSQQNLIAHVLPELKSLGASDGLSAKSERKYAKGVEKFVAERRPDRSLNNFLDVVRHNPACARCKTMLALAELDSGDWDGASRHVNEAARMTVKEQSGGSPESLLIGGVMESWMHHPQEATNFLVWADKLHPKDALVLQEIGRAQLQLRQYGMADAYLERAIHAGAGPDARLMCVQALLGEDDLDAASFEMARYLNGRNPKTLPVETRRIWDMVQNRKEIRALYAGPNKRKRRIRQAERVNYLEYSTAQLKGLEPAKNQSELKPILAAVGKNVAALFRNFQSTTSLEEIQQEKLGRKGKVLSSIEGKFRYLCLMPSDPAVPGFTEYRRNVKADAGRPGGLKQGYMLTSGFASDALIFHPDFQPGSQFRYLGRQTKDGHETYVVAFAQIPMKAALVGSFISGNLSAPTFEQGLAWIDTQTDQIVRLQTALLKPLPELRLTEESTRIDYQEVRFSKLAEAFWLPKEVTVTVDWQGKTLRNEHRYSDFRLFSVANSEKIGKPQRKTPGSKEPAGSKNRN